MMKPETVTLQRQKELQKEKCPICGELGIITPIELLPKSGIAMQCSHNGTVHKWAEYDSVESVFAKNVTVIDPKTMICPVCRKEGRINSWIPTAKKMEPWNVDYQIVHGSMKGTWGKKKRHHKLLRHNILTQEHRDLVLKRLGRYIPTANKRIVDVTAYVVSKPKKEEKKELQVGLKKNIHAKINCPRCHKRGRLNLYYHPDAVYVVAHENLEGSWGKSKRGKLRRCYMRRGPEMEIAEKKYNRIT